MCQNKFIVVKDTEFSLVPRSRHLVSLYILVFTLKYIFCRSYLTVVYSKIKMEFLIFYSTRNKLKSLSIKGSDFKGFFHSAFR